MIRIWEDELGAWLWERVTFRIKRALWYCNAVAWKRGVTAGRNRWTVPPPCESSSSEGGAVDVVRRRASCHSAAERPGLRRVVLDVVRRRASGHSAAERPGFRRVGLVVAVCLLSCGVARGEWGFYRDTVDNVAYNSGPYYFGYGYTETGWWFRDTEDPGMEWSGQAAIDGASVADASALPFPSVCPLEGKGGGLTWPTSGFASGWGLPEYGYVEPELPAESNSVFQVTNEATFYQGMTLLIESVSGIERSAEQSVWAIAVASGFLFCLCVNQFWPRG